jgi:glutamyl-tRNA reductase
MSTVELVVVGLSYNTAPIELREKLAAPIAELPDRVRQLALLPGMRETVFLSTCNRVEVYGAAGEPATAVPAVQSYLHQSAATDLSSHLYTFTGAEAVRHIFRVASSLDSMIIGEPQILGQVKDAFSLASEAGVTGPVLNRCFHRAFQVAKRVRSETGVARAAVSMSAVAVELARTIFDNLDGKRVLLIGAGEMAELAARHLASAGVAEIIVANRSLERAQRIASEVGGQAHALEEMSTLLEIADIVLSSTAASTFVVQVAEAKRVLKARKYRPLFFIDLGVPRDIDPRVGELSNVYLYNVDDLRQVSERNREQRSREAAEAEGIVEKESVEFLSWVRSLEVVPTVVALREKCVRIAHKETERALQDLGSVSDSQRQVVQRLAESIVNKILHSPLTQLKREGMNGATDIVATAQRLFELEVTEVADPAAPPVAETAEVKK